MEGYELSSVGILKQGRYHKPQPAQERTQGKQNLDNAFGLSAREMAVLYLVTEGLADKEIATALGVTAYTVNKHVGAILVKMNVRSRTAAAVLAIRSRLFPGDSFEMMDHVPLRQDEPAPRWSR